MAKTILVVDDDPTQRRLIQAVLERDGNVPAFDTLRQESTTAADILAHHAAALPLEVTP